MMDHNSQNRRSKHHKKKFFKTTVYYWLTVFSLLLIGILSYAIYKHLTENKIQPVEKASIDTVFNQKESELVKKIRAKQKEEGVDSTESINNEGDIQIIMYSPTSDTLKTEFSTLKEDVNKKVQALSKNETTKIKIVAQIKKGFSSEFVTEYKTVIDSYSWENGSWIEKAGEPTSVRTVNNQTSQPVTLRDLFNDNEGNLLAVKQVIQQQLLDEYPNNEEVCNEVLSMPDFSLDATTFTYQPESITLVLSKKISEKNQVTVPYTKIPMFINQNFVDQSKLATSTTDLDPNKKYIALTFDDGPNPTTTPRLLNILKEKGVTATFFMLGQNVAKNQELTKQVYDEGHEVASHSFSHPNLTTLDTTAIAEQVTNTDKVIYKATGTLPTDFRPPYGAVNKDVAKITGKPIIQWTVDSQDWQSHNTSAIIQRINDTAYNNSIILMHDIYPETVDAVPVIIDNLRTAGYEIIPSKQLLMNKTKPLYMYYSSNDEREIQ